MKPVRRKIKRHFGLSSNAVAVRAKHPWYFDWLFWTLLLALGYLIAYFQFSFDKNSISELMAENQRLNAQLIKVDRELQIEKAVEDNLHKELKNIQDENIAIKAELLFYKNMTESKK